MPRPEYARVSLSKCGESVSWALDPEAELRVIDLIHELEKAKRARTEPISCGLSSPRVVGAA